MSKSVIVLKFGGTTIGSDRLYPFVIERIQDKLDAGYHVVAVVSAMGRKGDPYATDTLLNLLPEEQFVCLRERDLLMACGEVISAVVLASNLRRNNISATARAGFEAGIITDNAHSNAQILHIDPKQLHTDLELFGTVVVTGFQGISMNGQITTLGRGGSDTSALAIGAALNAQTVEIYTDQKGIYTADPVMVPSAYHLNHINAEDIRQMAWLGSKILHPRAAELAIRHHLHVTVGKVDDPNSATMITPYVKMEAEAVITGIACGNPVVQLTVPLCRERQQRDVADIFEMIAGAGISMDMFTITEDLVRFTVSMDQRSSAISVLTEHHYIAHAVDHCSKVSIVGAGMHGMHGVMARFTRSLVNANIPILQTVDSHATISALVPASRISEAAQVLHREFLGQSSNAL